MVIIHGAPCWGGILKFLSDSSSSFSPSQTKHCLNPWQNVVNPTVLLLEVMRGSNDGIRVAFREHKPPPGKPPPPPSWIKKRSNPFIVIPGPLKPTHKTWNTLILLFLELLQDQRFCKGPDLYNEPLSDKFCCVFFLCLNV